MKARLSIIIPTFNRAHIFSATLESAYQSVSGMDAEIIVVNDSKENQIVIDEKYKNTVLVFNNPKSGVASARNFGARQAKGNLLLFLDDDILISKKNISDTLCFFDEHENQKVCLNLNWDYPQQVKELLPTTSFGRYLSHYGFTMLEGKGWLNHTFAERNTFQVISAAASFYLGITKNLFESIGGYSEVFSHAGFEDHDFASRLKKHSITCYILPSSYVYHNESDRIDFKPWMTRKVRGGITRRQAVDAGYTDLQLHHGFFKKFCYRILVKGKPFLFFLERIIPNSVMFDRIYYRLMNLLLGTSIYEGYSKK
jgi:GT2 family glycosyltransferase